MIVKPTEDPLAFRLFTEIGIIEQLARNRLERGLPDGLKVSQFGVLNHLVRLGGVFMQPMSQALQEYSAMAPYYETIHDRLTSQPGERVQMLARLGFSKDIDPAPRWPLETRVTEG